MSSLPVILLTAAHQLVDQAPTPAQALKRPEALATPEAVPTRQAAVTTPEVMVVTVATASPTTSL